MHTVTYFCGVIPSITPKKQPTESGNTPSGDAKSLLKKNPQSRHQSASLHTSRHHAKLCIALETTVHTTIWEVNLGNLLLWLWGYCEKILQRVMPKSGIIGCIKKFPFQHETRPAADGKVHVPGYSGAGPPAGQSQQVGSADATSPINPLRSWPADTTM